MGLSSFFKNLFGPAKETAEDFADKAETIAEGAITKIQEVSEPILQTAADFANEAKNALTEYADKASDTLHDIIDSITESTDENHRVITETVFDVSEDSVSEISEESDK
ncbi:YtxH domain-containing protein [Flavobacterium gelatinilyticum]|uniref:YtxH domain-containing protein n=1 Tax=Flavobacterium gelatinilyticum TaxID=3003260 RepID=UPI0024818642|nr:YtxH domain-containing protein [Flavobacterium gelatinilyticum]